MKFLLKTVLCVIISLSILIPKVKAEAPQIKIPETIQKQIEYYSDLYGADSKTLSKVAQCESQLGKKNKGDLKNGVYLAIGIYMYHNATWDSMANMFYKEYPTRHLDKYSNQDQIELTAWVFAKHPELRKHWTTYIAYSRGGTYTFYSKILERWFTVVCK